MTYLHAIVMGAVQGLTEFLPVSSSAHLLLVDKLFFHRDSGAAFTAIIQWGTLLATLIYFRKDIASILLGRKAAGLPASPPARAASAAGSEGGGVAVLDPPATEENTLAGDAAPDAGPNLLLPIIIGTIPVVVVGLLLKKHIEHEFRGLLLSSISMGFFAILLALAERQYSARRQLGSIGIKDGLIVGIAQVFALVPGASRSGTTLTGALFDGLERSTAARFSFLLGLPAVFGAGAKELWDARHNLAAAGGATELIIATVVAFIVGWATIDWLLKFLRRHPTYVFVVYRIILSLTLIALLRAGIIHDTPSADDAKPVARIVQPVRAG